MKNVRGGSWVSVAGDCRSAQRFGLGPAYWPGDIGFRLVTQLETSMNKSKTIEINEVEDR
jgi:formylglycine-generating enzyme required for sulfatase activity